MAKFVQRARARLADESGESFAEILIALLIVGLATAALVTMTLSASSMAASTSGALDALYAQESKLAQDVSTDTDGSACTILVSLDGKNTNVEGKAYHTQDLDCYVVETDPASAPPRKVGE